MKEKEVAGMNGMDGTNQNIAENRPFFSKPNSRFNRRSFLKLMGASAVMAGAACRRPTEQIIPSVSRAPELQPGLPNYYASVMPDGTGITVKTRDGRPIKLAGNKQHPFSSGGMTAFQTASIMDLYDPDRLRRGFRFLKTKEGRKKRRATRKEILIEANAALKTGRYLLITQPGVSPSQKKMVQAFLNAVPNGQHIEINPDPTASQIAAGQEMCYGKALVPNYHFDRARYILSFDGDFLGTMLQPAAFTASFARSRSLKDKGANMSRLAVIEAGFSLTGSNADERYSVRPGEQYLAAFAIAHELISTHGIGSRAQAAAISDFAASKLASTLGHAEGFFESEALQRVVKKIAADIARHKGRSLVIAGSPLTGTEESENLQIAVNLLNSILGNDGKTIDHASPLNISPGSSYRRIQALLNEVRSGGIKNVILAGVNPIYHLPEFMRAKEALKKASYVLSLTDRMDESTEIASAVLPLSHFLETWGDTEIISGLLSVRQPVIRPLYDSLSLEDYYIQLAGGVLLGSKTHYEFVRKQWAKRNSRGKSFNDFWIDTLHAGYLLTNPSALNGTRRARNFRNASLSRPSMPSSAKAKLGSRKNGLRLGLYLNVQVLDGSLANNAYRQELPEPVYKIVWDNFAAMLPETARKLGLKQGSIVKVQAARKSLELPVHLQPGLHPGSVIIALGYGRTAVGKTGNDVGKNALELISSLGRDGLHPAFSGLNVKLENTGNERTLAGTQKIYSDGRNTEDSAIFAPKGMPSAPYGSSSQQVGGGGEYERPIVREATLAEFQSATFDKNPEKVLQPPAMEYPKGQDIMTSWKHDEMRWHMIVDLNQCTGCAACVTSCNSENNVPTVGPDEVAMGREMQWMRIDRYFKGDEASPETAHQPMLCQHCENAPCENVCPVAATTHSSEGLNLMTYNRCVGTRYCANNCPYKVRRFNYFENWRYMEGLDRIFNLREKLLHVGTESRPMLRSPQELGLNPDVTVRPRGVMEKCSFCIQRIAGARQEMKRKGKRRIPDGSLRTACQEVCPSDAISFGDINDTKSKVYRSVKSKRNRDKRSYQVLDFIGVKPSVTYLARIRNTDKKDREKKS